MLSESDLTILSLSLALASDDLTLTDADKNQLINIAIELECDYQQRSNQLTDITTRKIEPWLNTRNQLLAHVTKYQQILSELSEEEIREALPSKADLMAVFPGLGVASLNSPPGDPNPVLNTQENDNAIYTAAPKVCRHPETAKTVLPKLLELVIAAVKVVK